MEEGYLLGQEKHIKNEVLQMKKVNKQCLLDVITKIV